MTIFESLQTLGLPIAYGRFTKPVEPPFLALLGQGQSQILADNTYVAKQDDYNLEYYFTAKNPDVEDAIEELLLSLGRMYTKSEDIYIEDERMFYIYYSF